MIRRVALSVVVALALLGVGSATPAQAAQVKITSVKFAVGAKSLNAAANSLLANKRVEISESTKVTLKVYTLEKKSSKASAAKSLGSKRLAAVKAKITALTGIRNFTVVNNIVKSGSAATVNRVDVYVTPVSGVEKCIRRSGLSLYAPVVRSMWLEINQNGSQDGLYQVHLASASGTTFRIGSNGSWPNLYCGGAGNDTLNAALLTRGGHMDWFFGNGGADTVATISGGGFRGGEGNDTAFLLTCLPGQSTASFFSGDGGNDVISNLNSIPSGQPTRCGEAMGGSGDDTVNLLSEGTFQGDEGNDQVLAVGSGYLTFYGGADSDSIAELNSAQQNFDGDGGADTVGLLNGGTFRGLDGADVVEVFQSGFFNGGLQSDSVLDVILDGQAKLAGRTTGVESCRSVTANSYFVCPTTANQSLTLIP